MEAASITTCIAEFSTRSAIRTAPARELNRPWTRAGPMCRAVKTMGEWTGSTSRSPRVGGPAKGAIWRVTSPSEAREFSATMAVAR